MTLCKNKKIQKGGQTKKKPILSLYENENIKKGDGKKIQKYPPPKKKDETKKKRRKGKKKKKSLP